MNGSREDLAASTARGVPVSWKQPREADNLTLSREAILDIATWPSGNTATATDLVDTPWLPCMIDSEVSLCSEHVPHVIPQHTIEDS